MQTDFPARINARRVGHVRGWRWIVEAFYLVRQQPLTWMLLAGGYLLIHFAVAAIPLLGPPLTFFLGPIFAGGFVLAAQQAEHGSELRLSVLFAGFRQAPRALLNVGMLYLGLLLLAMMLLSAAMPLLGIHMIAGQNAQELPRLEGPVSLFMLLSAALMFLLSLCYWFAPALVVLNGLGPWQALRDSFRAGMANWPAVLLSAFMLALLLFLALLPLGLGLLLWFPVLYVTAYTGWKDLFAPQAD
ncbi:possible transmembrane protein [Aquitalea magnusonii]|uniref:Possible transmembrane protein n=1 Tax=Aquitalea magnusonii TaxID=332411 RepID=A0A3G9GIA0_9NEIS|nr:BPSS1780 family membrane protein [Aquitalea magnusonii]BBF87618.1 possible transmembrane protein [Aquitalea magnusonii]